MELDLHLWLMHSGKGRTLPLSYIHSPPSSSLHRVVLFHYVDQATLKCRDLPASAPCMCYHSWLIIPFLMPNLTCSLSFVNLQK